MKLAVIWAVGYRVAGAKTSYEIRNTRNERNSASVTLLLASAANLTFICCCICIEKHMT